jgi:hypothetical protein
MNNKMKRPEPPVPYSESNWASYGDYIMAKQAYYNALSIWEMYQEKDEQINKKEGANE